MNNEWTIQYMHNFKIRIVQLIPSSVVPGFAIVCFWSNINPAGSGTAKISWKERLLALHFQEEVFTTSFPCFPGHMFFVFFSHFLYITLYIFYIVVQHFKEIFIKQIIENSLWVIQGTFVR